MASLQPVTESCGTCNSLQSRLRALPSRGSTRDDTESAQYSSREKEDAGGRNRRLGFGLFALANCFPGAKCTNESVVRALAGPLFSRFSFSAASAVPPDGSLPALGARADTMLDTYLAQPACWPPGPLPPALTIPGDHAAGIATVPAFTPAPTQLAASSKPAGPPLSEEEQVRRRQDTAREDKRYRVMVGYAVPAEAFHIGRS